jgi:hypothetical protein
VFVASFGLIPNLSAFFGFFPTTTAVGATQDNKVLLGVLCGADILCSEQYIRQTIKNLKLNIKQYGFLPVLVLFILIQPPLAAAISDLSPQTTSISIIASAPLLKNPITSASILDSLELLRRAFPKSPVRLNDPASEVIIELPSLRDEADHAQRIGTRNPHHQLVYPAHDYTWHSRTEAGRTILTLASPSYQGVCFGLYGLLQEKLGFRFIHPKQSIIPRYDQWPLAPEFRWKAVPRFQKKGFHVHTLHPVELTEQLHNRDYPGALNDVKEYIDWLVRNQQNLFQFFLLRGVDHTRWISHAREIAQYAHSRGVLIGVEVSLAMLQQKAFQLVKLLRPWPYKRQADTALAWLMQVPWDFVTVDFTMGEYLPDLGGLMPGLKDHVLDEISTRYRGKTMTTTHVIRCPETGGQLRTGAGRGVLIHTVMCYSLKEPAPVYGNQNQGHMLTLAQREIGDRETWYWPESAYWVAFDNSVPLLLLPYLDARFTDMAAMERVGAEGHLTFSSGWEWGYWLIDWSVARWAWQYKENGRPVRIDPLTRLRDLFPDERSRRLWEKALALQKEYLKDNALMPFFSAADPSAELFWPFNKPFAPRLPFTLCWLRDSASKQDIEKIEAGPIAGLREYSRRMHACVHQLRSRNFAFDDIGAELTDALEVTALRAEHRALTLRALIVSRRSGKSRGDTNALLVQAADVRGRAMDIVRRQEQRYRYPLELIASKRKDFTAYHFGYLYPVNELHFWKREEEQVRNKRFDAFFMNVWNFRRVVGIESLAW